jgi:hypothetical protein
VSGQTDAASGSTNGLATGIRRPGSSGVAGDENRFGSKEKTAGSSRLKTRSDREKSEEEAVERIKTVNVATINVSTRDHTAITSGPALLGKGFQTRNNCVTGEDRSGGSGGRQ